MGSAADLTPVLPSCSPSCSGWSTAWWWGSTSWWSAWMIPATAPWRMWTQMSHRWDGSRCLFILMIVIHLPAPPYQNKSIRQYTKLKDVFKIKRQLLKMVESLIIYYAGEAFGYRPSACALDLSGSLWKVPKDRSSFSCWPCHIIWCQIRQMRILWEQQEDWEECHKFFSIAFDLKVWENDTTCEEAPPTTPGVLGMSSTCSTFL